MRSTVGNSQPPLWRPTHICSGRRGGRKENKETKHCKKDTQYLLSPFFSLSACPAPRGQESKSTWFPPHHLCLAFRGQRGGEISFPEGKWKKWDFPQPLSATSPTIPVRRSGSGRQLPSWRGLAAAAVDNPSRAMAAPGPRPPRTAAGGSELCRDEARSSTPTKKRAASSPSVHFLPKTLANIFWEGAEIPREGSLRHLLAQMLRKREKTGGRTEGGPRVLPQCLQKLSPWEAFFRVWWGSSSVHSVLAACRFQGSWVRDTDVFQGSVVISEAKTLLHLRAGCNTYKEHPFKSNLTASSNTLLGSFYPSSCKEPRL